MWKIKLIGIMIGASMAVKNLFISPSSLGFEKIKKSEYTIKKYAFDPIIFESSGLGQIDSLTFFTHGDSGNSPEIYLFGKTGKVVDTLYLNGLKNVDWESATTDDHGNIYIGDFGNNLNKREDLRIYKIAEGKAIDTIRFSYKNQTQFPPNNDPLIYDCEAMFWHEDHLYLISKSRNDQPTYAYKVADRGGNYVLMPIDSMYFPHLITGADIDPKTNTIYLLSYGAIYSFEFLEDNFFSRPLGMMKFSRGRQNEAISHYGKGNLLLTNETGKLFVLTR